MAISFGFTGKLHEEIEALRGEVAALKARNDALEAENRALKSETSIFVKAPAATIGSDFAWAAALRSRPPVAPPPPRAFELGGTSDAAQSPGR